MSPLSLPLRGVRSLSFSASEGKQAGEWPGSSAGVFNADCNRHIFDFLFALMGLGWMLSFVAADHAGWKRGPWTQRVPLALICASMEGKCRPLSASTRARSRLLSSSQDGPAREGSALAGAADSRRRLVHFACPVEHRKPLVLAEHNAAMAWSAAAHGPRWCCRFPGRNRSTAPASEALAQRLPGDERLRTCIQLQVVPSSNRRR